MLPLDVLAHYRGLADLHIRVLSDESSNGFLYLRVRGQTPMQGVVDRVDQWLARFVLRGDVRGWYLYHSEEFGMHSAKEGSDGASASVR